MHAPRGPTYRPSSDVPRSVWHPARPSLPMDCLLTPCSWHTCPTRRLHIAMQALRGGRAGVGWPQDAPSMTVSRGPRVGALGARAGPECGFTVAHGVSAVRHKPPESGDALAGRAPRAPVDPTSPWKASGVRVGAAGGSRSVLEAGVVSVVILVVVNLWARRLRTVVAAGRVGWVWLLEKSTTARRGPRNGTVCRIWSERSPPCGCQCAREGADRHLLDTARRFAVGV